jgi:hypothetical protein
MLAIKKARKLIEANPTDPASITLAELVLSLETEASFNLTDIYTLDYKRFELALEILAEWRLDRYYAKKLRLIDASTQVVNQPSDESPAPGHETSEAIAAEQVATQAAGA